MSVPRSMGVYMLTHVVSGVFYIGSTANLQERRWSHLSSLKGGYHRSKELQNSFTVTTDYDFKYELFDDREEAYDREEELIDLFRLDPLCANTATDVRGGYLATLDPASQKKFQQLAVAAIKSMERPKGVIKHSEETIEKMRAIANARDPSFYRRGYHISDEHKAAISKAQSSRVHASGYTRSAETRAKMSIASTKTNDAKRKVVSINGIVYKSSGHAAAALGFCRRTIINRLISDDVRWTSWYYT